MSRMHVHLRSIIPLSAVPRLQQTLTAKRHKRANTSSIFIQLIMASLKVYKMAVCLFPDLTQLDMHGPVEILTGFSTEVRKKYAHVPFILLPDGLAIDPTYVSHTLEPVQPMCGPPIVPSATYADSKEQFDIILIPGGAGAVPGVADPSSIEFLKRQGPGAKHILSVCNGSWVLAASGLLDGQKATTNKFLFKMITEATKEHNITWIPKARWVVTDDKKIWTSSGITAGMDLAAAFLAYLTTPEFSKKLTDLLEYTTHGEGDDQFAEIHGLV